MFKLSTKLIAVLIILCAFWLRAPSLSSNLPYFTDEDEAHHFNRVVEMVKKGEFNPQYFLKPSLHFYLRMPITAAAFLYDVRKGEIRSLKEIETRDPFGLAGYSFSTSHPTLAKANRLFGLVLSLLSLILVYLIAHKAFLSERAGLLAMAITALSPALVGSSAVIGVDPITCFLSLCSVWTALFVRDNFSFSKFFAFGILCGLTVSSKYNAAPIALLPLIVTLSHSRTICVRAVLLALLAPPLGFLLGSPFILASLPLFLDHVAYEIWHYGIAGHEGHTAEPGWSQFVFYISWLKSSALGIITLIFAALGILALRKLPWRTGLITFVFPALYLLLMINQRANFTRNMHVLIPFCALLAAYAADLITAALKKRGLLFSQSGFLTLAALMLIIPLIDALSLRSTLSNPTESRTSITQWINESRTELGDIALSGQLQIAAVARKARGIERVDQSTALTALWLAGYDSVIINAQRALGEEEKKISKEIKRIEGEKATQRIVSNPEIVALKFLDPQQVGLSVRAAGVTVPTLTFPSAPGTGKPCAVSNGTGDESASEDYCWLTTRISRLKLGVDASLIVPGRSALKLRIMSPWQGQILTISRGSWSASIPFEAEHTGVWRDITLALPATASGSSSEFEVSITKVHSPRAFGISEDSRRLGLAVQSARIVTE